MRESLKTPGGETPAEDHAGASGFLPPRMLDLVDLTLAQLRKLADPQLDEAVAGVKSAAANGKFGDDTQMQRD